ncbi:MAG: hypothetical protein IJ876_03260 [Elusimicrobiaceae bacterium]|nr:hypothetical protein [Elusimicrobiaceae bacterium]
MKKLLILILCSCLLPAMAQANTLNTRVERAVTKASKKQQPAPVITRDPTDQLVLNLLGTPYTLILSEEDDGTWTNAYLPEGRSITDLDTDDPNTDVILISKIPDTTCADEIGNLEDSKAYTYDTRNPNDQILSGGNKSTYAVMRYIQSGDDVFYVVVMVKRNTQSDEDWQQLQKSVFKATRSTPAGVLTTDFVEAACRFGSDCR